MRYDYSVKTLCNKAQVIKLSPPGPSTCFVKLGFCQTIMVMQKKKKKEKRKEKRKREKDSERLPMSRNKVNELKRKVLRDLKAHILSALMVNADFLLPLPPFLSLSFVITVHVSCVEEPMIIRLQKWTKDHQKRAFNYNYKGLSIGVSRVPHVRKNLLPLVGNKETRLSTLHARWR